MTKVIVKQDCGNSPKNLLLRDFNVAFAENNLDLMLSFVSDDIIMEMVGAEKIEGKQNLREFLNPMMDGSIKEYCISTFITHGKSGAVNGEFIMNDGEQYGFCDVYEFSSASGKMISKITSFVIKK